MPEIDSASKPVKGKGFNLNELKEKYSYLVIPEHKKQFIKKYGPLIEKSGNPEYLDFLNSCILEYNSMINKEEI